LMGARAVPIGRVIHWAIGNELCPKIILKIKGK